MSADRVVRIEDVSGFSEVETVRATAHEVGGVLQWRYERDVALRAGDAMENPPPGGKAGDVCTLRIIRGYAGLEKPDAAEA